MPEFPPPINTGLARVIQYRLTWDMVDFKRFDVEDSADEEPRTCTRAVK
jgi:hypothetical protein